MLRFVAERGPGGMASRQPPVSKLLQRLTWVQASCVDPVGRGVGLSGPRGRNQRKQHFALHATKQLSLSPGTGLGMTPHSTGTAVATTTSALPIESAGGTPASAAHSGSKTPGLRCCGAA